MVRPLQPDVAIQRRVSSLVGTPNSWTAVSGGFSSAGLWTIDPRGRKLFVKAAVSDDTARFLRDEMRVLAGVNGARFLPEVIAFDDDGERPILILEDLTEAHWPPPWSTSQIDLCFGVLEDIARTPPPPTLASAAANLDLAGYWPSIAQEPAVVVGLGVVTADWLALTIDALIELSGDANLTGHQLLHCDIRSDNLCFSDRVVVVDWNWAAVGNPILDVVGWLPSLYLEGGPAPWELLTGHAEMVAGLGGFFLSHATKPRDPQVRADIRRFQRDQGVVCLEWLSHELGIPSPDGSPTMEQVIEQQTH
ncbi:MAG: aminoglycoside phosphotransferase family protein [Acidimicrobiia bacterium]|nr:aminoglycoside phosphotransferase family protein [Acidimicrobiia bacterium]